MSLPVLYGTIYCPFVQRARIVLAMVGKDYVFKAVDLMNKPKQLTDISPYGKVPVMVDDGKVIYESAAINQYIDEKWGHGKLMGDDPFHRAMHRVSTHWSNTKFAPAVYHSLFNVNKTPDAENLKRVDEQLAFLESRMNPAGTFMIGDQFGFADVMSAPFFKRLPLLAHFRGYEVPSNTKFPRIKKLMDAIDKELDTHPIKDMPLDTPSLIKGYEPFVTGKVTIDPSYWSY